MSITAPVEYRGHEIAAEKVDENQWRPIVDGDYVGQRIFLGSRDALRAAEGAVRRKTGGGERREPYTIDPDAPEPEWVVALREAVAS